jgi:hypothetical protein
MSRHANRKTRAQLNAPQHYNKRPWAKLHKKPSGKKKRVTCP